MDESKKKTRTANWRDVEIRALLGLVDLHKERLFQSFSSTWTCQKKNKLWDEICSHINARGEMQRTRLQVGNA
jgi:hypothetical protein